MSRSGFVIGWIIGWFLIIGAQVYSAYVHAMDLQLQEQLEKRIDRYEKRVEKLEKWRLDEAYTEGNRRRCEHDKSKLADGGRLESAL